MAAAKLSRILAFLAVFSAAFFPFPPPASAATWDVAPTPVALVPSDLAVGSGSLVVLRTPTGPVSVELSGLATLLEVAFCLWIGTRFVLFVVRRAYYLF